MATATHKELTPEQSQAISARRKLTLRIATLEADYAKQQELVGSLGQVLLCGAKHRESRSDKERKLLRSIGEQLFQAERELAALYSASPGAKLMDLFETQESEK